MLAGWPLCENPRGSRLHAPPVTIISMTSIWFNEFHRRWIYSSLFKCFSAVPSLLLLWFETSHDCLESFQNALLCLSTMTCITRRLVGNFSFLFVTIFNSKATNTSFCNISMESARVAELKLSVSLICKKLAWTVQLSVPGSSQSDMGSSLVESSHLFLRFFFKLLFVVCSWGVGCCQKHEFLAL